MRNLWRPETFQGGKRKSGYFEGWYFKHSGGPGTGVWSFIPGISLGGKAPAAGVPGNADPPGESAYSFVQAIEGATGRSWWFQYPAEEFSASETGLDIRVGPNRFSAGGVELDLSDGESRIKGSFRYGPFSRMEFPFWRPGVMGPFTFVPRMECNHGLVSMDHRVDGGIDIDGRRLTIRDGRGYIEKDWGRSMPEAWIWTQSNDFAAAGDSAMLSVARIPWLGSAFRGFLCVVALGGEKRLFATYNGSLIERLSVTDGAVECRIVRHAGRDSEESVDISVSRSRGGILRAPVSGLLTRRISEAVDARMEVAFSGSGAGSSGAGAGGLRRREPYRASSPCAGLEVAGDTALLL